MIVVDASVFNKLFLNEPDRNKAQDMFRLSILRDIPLIAPQLLLYEALSAALHYQIPFIEIHKLLEMQREAGMRLVEPSLTALKLAHDIARHCNDKSGYPSLPGCIYHALALAEGGVFVTADKKHASKTSGFGSVKLLDEWTSTEHS